MNGPPSPKRARLSTNENNDSPNTNQTGEIVPKPSLYFSWLDDKTLAKIFSPLKLYDLLQMYEVHEAYKKAIAEEVMKNRPLNISEISNNYDVRDALKYLGAFTPEVIIKQSDIQYKKDLYSRTEEIVRLIGKRCSKKHLKKVTIVFDSTDNDANAFRIEMPESVLGIESLTIEGVQMKKAVKCDEFLQKFKENEIQLQSITLKDMDSPENCLKILNCEGVRELTIENCRLQCQEFWTEFFQKGIASLESLTWHNVNSTDFIGPVDLATSFPALKRLHLEVRCLKVAKLPELKRLDLHQMELFGSEASEFVSALKSSVGSIEELSIKVKAKPALPRWRRTQGSAQTISSDKVKSLWSKAMQLSTNLRTIKMEYVGVKADDIVHLIEQIPHVSTIHLIGSGSFCQQHIKSFVKRADLRSLKLQLNLYISDVMIASLATYRKEWHNDSPPIDIYLKRPLAVVKYMKRALKTYARNRNIKLNHIRLHSLG